MSKLSKPLEQGTKEWLEWRKSGIGGSDANAIMGASPWQSALDIWKEKTGESESGIKDNYAMKHGRETEPVARKKIEEALSKHFGKPVKLNPECYEDDIQGLPWKCSYDGIDENAEITVEIKCPTRPHSILSDVPDKYKPQVQHQLLGINPKHAFYCEYYAKEDKLEILEIHKDNLYAQRLIAAELSFWELVKNKKEPEGGVVNMNNNYDFTSAANAFIRAKEASEQAEKRLEEAKARLTKLAEVHHLEKAVANGVVISKKFRQGNIDYKAKEIVEALKDLDLEEFRKKGSEFFDIRIKGTKEK